jgi:hypothetical protein
LLKRVADVCMMLHDLLRREGHLIERRHPAHPVYPYLLRNMLTYHVDALKVRTNLSKASATMRNCGRRFTASLRFPSFSPA